MTITAPDPESERLLRPVNSLLKTPSQSRFLSRVLLLDNSIKTVLSLRIACGRSLARLLTFGIDQQSVSEERRWIQRWISDLVNYYKAGSRVPRLFRFSSLVDLCLGMLDLLPYFPMCGVVLRQLIPVALTATIRIIRVLASQTATKFVMRCVAWALLLPVQFHSTSFICGREHILSFSHQPWADTGKYSSEEEEKLSVT